MTEITFYKFLELPYLRQKLIYNQIKKSNGSLSKWQTQLIEVCTSGKIEKLKLLSLTRLQSLITLCAGSGIGKSTAKKIYEIILEVSYNDLPI